ncbi:MAG: S-layer homology domain-containing protein [Acutalibacter sp.]|nr:S-layer homology domain-containing protein [Acutalibacter sp.]
MSRWRRMLAFILVVILAVHGLPIGSDAQVVAGKGDVLPVNAALEDGDEDGGLEEEEPALPNTRMRFVQTGFRSEIMVNEFTGQEEEVGILTMSLQIRPERGANNETLQEGVFVFQTDSDRITPVTNPRADVQPPYETEERRLIRDYYSGRIAVVADDTSTMPAVFREFLHDEDKVKLVSSKGFLTAMNAENFNVKYTGYLVSGARTAETGKLDCYLQFYYTDSYYPEPMDEEGYINVIDLDFQCYAGDTDQVTPDSVLSAGAIYLPKNAAEAQDIVDQFKYNSSSSGEINFAMGGAGFIQKYLNASYAKTESQAYYYFNEPTLSLWRKGTLSRSTWSTKGSNSITEETAPGLWYQNMDSKYRVQYFTAGVENTVGLKGDDPDPDFYIPVDSTGERVESGEYPRYAIPTYDQSGDNDRERNWIPQVYTGSTSKNHMPLKYTISTVVANGAISSPQHEDFEAFIDGLKWEFLLNGESLNHFDITPGEIVPDANDNYLVREAILTDERLVGTKLENKKLWVLYQPDDPSQEFMRTPVGVTLDMLPSEIGYYDEFAEGASSPPKQDEEEDEEGDDRIIRTDVCAPQLHVSYLAADPNSYIWNVDGAGTVSGGEKARLSFQAIYDPEGRAMASLPIDVGLYVDKSIPGKPEIDTKGIVSDIKSSTGAEKVGFAVGNTQLDGKGTEIIDDAVLNGKAVVHATLQDQYHMGYQGRVLDMEFVPTEETQSRYDALRKKNPFQVVHTSGDSYTIIYRDGTTVNDVVEGEYYLRASYTEPNGDKHSTEDADYIIFVSKPKDRLTYINAPLSISHVQQDPVEVQEGGATGSIIKVIYDVPTRGSENSVTTYTEQVNIAELANQWRDLEVSVDDLSIYDLALDIRNASGTAIDLAKAASKNIQIDFKATDPSGKVLSAEDAPFGMNFDKISIGSFTFDNTTIDNTQFNLRLTVTFDGVTRFVEYQFTFARQQPTLQEIRIYAPYDGNGEEMDRYALDVPVKADSPVEYSLDIDPIDQYGSSWNWGAVEVAYSPGGRLYTGLPYEPWTIYAEDGLPEGVTLITDRGNVKYIQVTNQVKDCSFILRAKFAGCISNPMKVEIKRKPGVPTVMGTLLYNGNNQITSPTKTSPDAKFEPSILIYDQYDELMSNPTTWRYKVSPESAKEYISVNTKTGELTVKSCAPDCTVEITAVKAENGSSKSTVSTVTVKRDLPRPASVTVVEKSVAFPSSIDIANGADVMKYLTASGTTQYGDDQVLSQDSVTWVLESATFPGANSGDPDVVLSRTDPSDPNLETGDISFSGDTYSARNMVFLTAKGALRFGSTTLAHYIPKEIKVKVICSNGAETTQTIRITRETSVPQELFFPQDREDYSKGVQIPNVGETVTVPLIVYVRDQYGVVMDDAEVVWDYGKPLPNGVTIDIANKTITITHTAQAGSILLCPTCGNLQGEWYISLRQDQDLVPTSIDITGYKRGKGTVQSIPAGGLEFTLPAKPAAETAQSYEDYTMVWTVRDQFTNAISRSVRWSVKNVTGIRAEISNSSASAGIVRLYYTEEAKNNLASAGFTLRVEATENSAIYQEIPVKLRLDPSVPTYAVPSATISSEDGSVANGVLQVKLGLKEDPEKQASVTATVYDQYGGEMAGERAELWLSTAASGEVTDVPVGMRFDTDSRTLYVASNVRVESVNLVAAPVSKPGNIRAESAMRVTFDKGTRYPYELKLSEDNPSTYRIPYWVSDNGLNVPGVDGTDTVYLRAEIVSQYDTWMEDQSDLYHPIWEFVGDHEGVEFATGDVDGNGLAEGEDLLLTITNRAIPADRAPGQYSYLIKMRVHSSGDLTGSDFVKECTLVLTRDPAVPSYLYITGSDEDGNSVDPLQRPYAEDGAKVYQFDPVVYDQYGAPIQDAEIRMDLDVDSLVLPEDVVLEAIYAQGESAENGDEPIGYQIYRVETVMVGKKPQEIRTPLLEFDCLSGEMTIYPECDCIDQLTLIANHSILGEKTITFSFVQESRYPASVQVNLTSTEFLMSGNKKDIIQDHATPTVYDQYGEEFPIGNEVPVQWRLVLPDKDENGRYLPYDKELDENGNERIPSQFLVLAGRTDADGIHGVTVTVQPEKFYEDKTVLLECLVVDPADPAHWIYGYAPINVHRPKRSSYVDTVTVSFDAGEYGKLVGESDIVVEIGSAPQNPPGVKTEEGYGFMGWTSDGVLVVDASQIAVFSNIVYTAVYKDITNTKFVEGYGDLTFRPERHITRAEFVSMVVRSLGGFSSKAYYGSYFKDVDDKQWYASAIGYAKTMGIIDGYGDGTFRPNNPITRAEASRILADTAQLSASTYGTFTDVNPDAWYARYIDALAEAGVADGYGDGTFRPGNYITRAEATKLIVQITVNALNELERTNIQKYAYCPFTDLRRGHWAYAYILRAAGIA